jgi:hypothetical protein
MTTATMNIETLLQQLEKIRENHGDEAYEQARRGFAKSLILKPNGDEFIKRAFPDLDLDALRKEAEAEQQAVAQASPEEQMLAMIRQQVPNIKSQAQFNMFMGCFDALRATLNHYFGRNPDGAQRAREALNKALDMAAKMPELEDQVAEMPAEMRSEAARSFTEPPKEFHEHDKQRALLIKVAGFTDLGELDGWYTEHRQEIDEVVDQRLRNELFDAIRAKRRELAN